MLGSAMTFAEIVFFVLLSAGVFILLKPLQRKLESYFYKMLRSKKSAQGSVINITNYKKKDNDTRGSK
jgi:hypothetical protein